MNKNKGNILLFFLGFIILIYPHIAQIANNKIQQNVSAQFKEDIASIPEEVISREMNNIHKCNEAIYKNKEGFADPFTKEYKQERYKECQDHPNESIEFATLEIPKLQLEIPIYLGSSEEELSKGIGHVEGSSLPVGGKNTHTVLAGHRGMGTKEMFRHLDHLSEGDFFSIHTKEGELLYEVYDVSIVLPHETDVLQIKQNKDLASLLTCHPYRSNSHRLLVHGERIH